MESFRGKLMRDGQLMVDGVQGRMTVDLGPTGNHVWSGFFNVPSGRSVKVDEFYDLTLEDGRSGKIRIERFNLNPQGGVASFGSAS